MATDIEKLKQFKEHMTPYSGITPWEEIKVGNTYHIPPIHSLERRDVTVTEKTNTSLGCVRIDDGKKTELNMQRTSVYAKLLVKKRKF